MENNKRLFQIIDKETKKLVGILCKRVEVLEKHNALTPKLYKDIAKELIYEWSRGLKTVISLYKIEFTTKPEGQK